MSDIICVVPMTITDAILTYSNLGESDEADWVATANYGEGQRVIRNHVIYESLGDDNLGNDPALTESEIYWLAVSPTNKWKAFDTSTSTATKNGGDIVYSFKPGTSFNTFAALGLVDCSAVTITMTDPVFGVVYNVTHALSGVPTESSWWAFFFGTRKVPSQLVDLSVPPYPDATTTVTFTGGSGIEIGVIVLGTQQLIGTSTFGIRVGIRDFSVIEANDFGDIVLKQRAYARTASIPVVVEAAQVDSVAEFLAGVRAKPCLWLGTSVYACTTIFGPYVKHEVLIAYPTCSELSIDLQSMT